MTGVARQANGSAEDSFEPLEFQGKSKEFFGIWIVNVFLSIVTLGIYSAWAKVRTNRYFYGNTFYKGSSFEYTADPIKILKGRLLIVGLYAIFFVSLEILLNPFIAGAIFIFGLIMIPWLINRSIIFRLHNTKHRNIRFAHHAHAKKYYGFYFFHSILYVFSLGFTYGYSLNEFKKLLYRNSSYGSVMFDYHGKAGSVYWQIVKSIGFTLLFMIIGALVVFILSTLLNPLFVDATTVDPEEKLSSVARILIVVGVYLFYFFVGILGKASYDSYVGNYFWNNVSLHETKFQSTLKPTSLAWIYGTNVLAVIFSIGLFTPWARVRIARYKCENFAISCPDISSFIATSQQESTAIGEEAGDFFDIDIGF
ncbi:MAG: DUF898 domain-containing protein [Campylobacterales bacterium]|nr:DUF898 domain-containing protein [Campylobacterales bacterium]